MVRAQGLRDQGERGQVEGPRPSRGAKSASDQGRRGSACEVLGDCHQPRGSRQAATWSSSALSKPECSSSSGSLCEKATATPRPRPGKGHRQGVRSGGLLAARSTRQVSSRHKCTGQPAGKQVSSDQLGDRKDTRAGASASGTNSHLTAARVQGSLTEPGLPASGSAAPRSPPG